MIVRSKHNIRVDDLHRESRSGQGDPAFYHPNYQKLEDPSPTHYNSYKDQEVTQEGCGIKRVFRGWMKKVFGISPEKGTVEYIPPS